MFLCLWISQFTRICRKGITPIEPRICLPGYQWITFENRCVTQIYKTDDMNTRTHNTATPNHVHVSGMVAINRFECFICWYLHNSFSTTHLMIIWWSLNMPNCYWRYNISILNSSLQGWSLMPTYLVYARIYTRDWYNSAGRLSINMSYHCMILLKNYKDNSALRPIPGKTVFILKWGAVCLPQWPP